MTKKADANIAAFKKAGIKNMQRFEEVMQDKGFQEVSKEEILKFVLDSHVHKPVRATAENAIQRQFKYDAPTGYRVYIHTGMIGDDFSEKGSAWIMIIDTSGEREKRVLMREFYRNISCQLLEKLTAYAKFFKNIADLWPDGGVLVEDAASYKLRWELKNQTKAFVETLYMSGLTNKEISVIRTKENKRRKYFVSTSGADIIRERVRRKKWTN